jgi:hypothetical protein
MKMYSIFNYFYTTSPNAGAPLFTQSFPKIPRFAIEAFVCTSTYPKLSKDTKILN